MQIPSAKTSTIVDRSLKDKRQLVGISGVLSASTYVVLILSTYKYYILCKTGTCTCTLSTFSLNYLYLYLSTFIQYLWHH